MSGSRDNHKQNGMHCLGIRVLGVRDDTSIMENWKRPSYQNMVAQYIHGFLIVETSCKFLIIQPNGAGGNFVVLWTLFWMAVGFRILG